jgi:DNA-binding transcriptional LysR family regulator
MSELLSQAEARFMELLPRITRHANYAFRRLNADRREDALQAVLVFSYTTLRSLAEKGRLDEAQAAPLARFAIGCYRRGNISDTVQSSTDVLAERCRCLGRVRIQQMPDTFEQSVTEPHNRMSVERQVAFKIDFFESWYRQLPDNDRRLIRALAGGDNCAEAGRKLGVTRSAVSLRRKVLAKSWYEFINND